MTALEMDPGSRIRLGRQLRLDWVIILTLLGLISLASASSLPSIESASAKGKSFSLDNDVDEQPLLISFGAESGEKSRHSKKNLPTLPTNVPAPTPSVLPGRVPSKRISASDKVSSGMVDVDMSNLLEQNCLEHDNATQRACFEYCTQASSAPKYDTGKCDGDSNLCICGNTEDGTNKRVKLYKPKAIISRKRKISNQRQTKLIPVKEKGAFDCDHSPEANSICQVFCTTKGATHSACSLDQKNCLCFKTQSKTKLSKRKQQLKSMSKRMGRQFPEEESSSSPGFNLVIRGESTAFINPPDADTDAPDASSSVSSSLQRQLPYWPPPYQGYPQQHMQPQGCTAFSCVDNCPRHCDNLCTQNLQCYCSCPEDTVYYDYVDEGPSMFGNPFSWIG